MSVLAYRDGINAPRDASDSGVSLLTPEVALDVASPAWRDRRARVQFAKELMENYGDNRPWEDDANERAVEIAQKALSGELDFIEASIALSSMRYEAMPEVQEFFDPFSEIARNAVDFPIGAVRSAWEPKALAKKDVEIKDFSNLFRKQTLKACQALVKCLAV
ncbi:MAG: hypothetical protein ABI824_17975 [Acidobacteriota bacterium]